MLFADNTPLRYLLLIGYTLFFAIFMGWLIARMRRGFRCPDCGGTVEEVNEAQSQEGDRLLKLCKCCNTLWDIVGLSNRVDL